MFRSVLVNVLNKILQRQEKPAERMVKCPGCDLELPENDKASQIAHMEKNHPEIISQRLQEMSYD